MGGGVTLGGLTLDQLQSLACRFEGQSPQAVLRWACDTFGDGLCLACSFGVEDMVLLDMVCRIREGVHVFYLDTGLLFEETYRLAEEAARRFPIRLHRVLPELSLEEQARQHGPQLWRSDPDRCCRLRKVEPLRRFLAGYQAWVTGIRREQAFTRSAARPVEWDGAFHLVKVSPLVAWTWQDVWAYVRHHRVPHNPLHHQGYPSIGCQPCTAPVAPGEHPRAGRWRGLEKTECGLHAPGPAASRPGVGRR